MGAAPDPFAEVLRLLERARGEPAQEAALTLAAASLTADRAEAATGPSARGWAHRAEILRLSGRPAESGAALRRVIEARIEDGSIVNEGLLDLLDGLCAYEEVVALAPALRVRHPGRRWQWDPMIEEAERRLRLERDAPVTKDELARLRALVARGLQASPCRHEDDGRPVAAAAARDLGLDAEKVLAWVAALGACCCDCQVAQVRGPREPRK